MELTVRWGSIYFFTFSYRGNSVTRRVIQAMARHEEPPLFIIAQSHFTSERMVAFFTFPRSLTTEQLYPGPLGSLSHNGERLLAIRATADSKGKENSVTWLWM